MRRKSDQPQSETNHRGTGNSLLEVDEFASPLMRLLAATIDAVLGIVIYAVVYVIAYHALLALLAPESNDHNHGFWIVGVVLATGFLVVVAGLIWLAVLWSTTSRFGQTPGKRLLKIRVVGTDVNRLEPSQIAWRELFGKAPWWLLYVTAPMEWVLLWDVPIIPPLWEVDALHFAPSVGFWIWLVLMSGPVLWIIVDGKNQTLYDKVAGTYVVRA